MNPPYYVERSHYLLDRTVDSGRVWDLAATVRQVRAAHGGRVPVFLAGEGAGAVLAVYAALLESEVDGLVLERPPDTHMAAEAPALLNVLRVLDVPEAIGLLAPRTVTLVGGTAELVARSEAFYRSAGATQQLAVRP